MTLAELKAKYKSCIENAKAIQAGAKAEGRDLNEDQAKKVDDYLTEAEGYKAEIEAMEAQAAAQRQRLERLNRLDAEGRASNGRSSLPDDPGTSTQPHVTGGTPQFVNDPMKGFKTPREFFGLVMKTGSRQAEDPRLKYLAVAGTDEQQSGDNPSGGFLVPVGFSPELLTTPNESNPIAGRTTNLPMGAPTVSIAARTDKNHTTSVSGGLKVGRKAETVAAEAKKMEMEQVELKATTQFGFGYATEELLTDSPQSVAAILEAGFRDEFAAADLIDFLRGTGVGEPEGILNCPALVKVAKEGSQSAGTIVGKNIINMRSRIWGYGNAIWLANHDTLPQLATANITGDKSDVFLFNPSRGEDVPDMLLGRPIFFSEFCSTVGSLGDLILVNATQYLTGLYQRLESAESIHVRFDRHERAFKFFRRNAGKSWWRAALTPHKGTNTLSPFVALDVRA